MSTTYDVRAIQWHEGWELHISDDDVTQVRTLDKAVDQVRDYLDSMYDGDHSDAAIVITADLGGDEVEVEEAKRLMEESRRMQDEAAARIRAVTARLRQSGISVTDTAAILGVSRGRVSQLEGAKSGATIARSAAAKMNSAKIQS